MKPLSEVQLTNLLAAAQAEIGTVEEPKGSNAGPKVEAYLKAVGLPKGNPWCAAFVAWVGVHALGAGWPVPHFGGCASLGAWAKHEGVLHQTPQVGDLFLLYFPKLARFAHVGFISEEPDASGKWGTIEGNTSGAGSREGWGVFAHRRAFGPNDGIIQLGQV